MKTLLLSTILLFTVSLNAQNSYPIDGKWTYEASLNTMYIFDNGIRYTYYCIGSNCDSLYQTYQITTYEVTGTSANFCTTTEELTIYVTDCSSAAIGELNNTPKQLIKIVDVLGRETPFKPNTPLLYIYDDGTVERKVVLK